MVLVQSSKDWIDIVAACINCLAMLQVLSVLENGNSSVLATLTSSSRKHAQHTISVDKQLTASINVSNIFICTAD